MFSPAKLYTSLYHRFFLWADATAIGWFHRKLEMRRRPWHFTRDSVAGIRAYWERALEGKPRAPRRFLVETEHLNISTLIQNNTLHRLLAAAEGTPETVTGYAIHKDPDVETIASAYGVQRFFTCYTFAGFPAKGRALVSALNAFLRHDHGPYRCLPVPVDRLDIGDAIYDEFLRREKEPTYRRKSLRYFLYVYRGCFLYFRFKEALERDRITDVFTSHTVYSGAIMLKACATVNPEADLWITWPALRKFGFFRYKAAQCAEGVPDIRPLDRAYLERVRAAVTDEKLEEAARRLLGGEATFKFTSRIAESFRTDDREMLRDPDALVRELGFSPEKKTVLIYTHHFVDGVKRCPCGVYKDYYTWLKESLELLAANPHVNVLVQHHPRQLRHQCPVTSHDVLEEVRRETGAANLYSVPADVNKNVLFHFADAVVSACGTVGMEAPCFGIPVVVTSKAFYSDLGTTVRVQTPEAYREALAAIHELAPLSPEVQKEARLLYLASTGFNTTPFYFEEEEELDFPHDRQQAVEGLDRRHRTLPPLEESTHFRQFRTTLEHRLPQLCTV